MKNVLKFLILVLLTASLTSCEKIKSWFDVEIDTTLEGQLILVSDDTELKSVEAYSIDGSSDPIDLSNNEDLADYEDVIKGIKAKNVNLLVIGVDAQDVIIYAGSEFSISTPTNPGLTWPITEDWPIQQGTSVELTADDYSVLNKMLKGDEDVTFKASGTCSVGNVHITLTYGIKVTVEAEAI
jgi:hypothetical protein